MTHKTKFAMILFAVTGLLGVAWASPFCEAVTDRIPKHAAAPMEVLRAGLIGLRHAEPSPVVSKLVLVCNYSECCEIGISSSEAAHFPIIQGAQCSVGIVRRSSTIKRCGVGREYHIYRDLPKSGIFSRGRWSAVCINDLNNDPADQLQRRTLADVSYSDHDRRLRVKNSWHANIDFEPSALISLKVVSQISPLEKCDDGVSYNERYGDNFQADFPSLKGLIPGLLGLIGIAWGWLNLRHERYLPLSGVIFVVGCFLWAEALFFLLPWMASL